jgi:F-type H+-transporting ATPase subunit delta
VSGLPGAPRFPSEPRRFFRARQSSTTDLPAARGAFDVATEEPIMASVAGRYASALFELATEQNKVAEVEASLDQFQNMIDGSPDLLRLVRSPVFSADEQVKAVSAILAKSGIGGLAANFIQLIARNRRLFAVTDMIKSYRMLASKARGEVEAEVASAHPLTPAQLTQLTDTLRASVGGKQVNVRATVDSSLLGGIVVKMGSRMVDSSLRTKLASLKTRLKEVR